MYPLINDTLETPSGGWEFFEKETGRFIKGSSFSNLVQAVESHRLANNIETSSTAHRDVHAYICARFPEKCGLEREPIEIKKQFTSEDVVSFLQSVKQIIMGNGFVSQEEADRRAAICVMCPYNMQLPGCMSCGTAIPSLVMGLLAGRNSKYDRALKQCGVCGCDLKTKVHVPLKKNDDNKFPSYCWAAA